MPSSGNFCTINPVGAQGKGTVQTGTLGNGNLSVAIDEVCFGYVGVTSGSNESLKYHDNIREIKNNFDGYENYLYSTVSTYT